MMPGMYQSPIMMNQLQRFRAPMPARSPMIPSPVGMEQPMMPGAMPGQMPVGPIQAPVQGPLQTMNPLAPPARGTAMRPTNAIPNFPTGNVNSLRGYANL